MPLSHIIVITAGREYYRAGRCHSLISLSLLQGRCTAMPADATLSYHCHCCREGYCNVNICHSLISLSLLQGGSTAMPAGATLSYHCHHCREGVLPCWQVQLSRHSLPVVASPLSLGREVPRF